MSSWHTASGSSPSGRRWQTGESGVRSRRAAAAAAPPPSPMPRLPIKAPGINVRRPAAMRHHRQAVRPPHADPSTPLTRPPHPTQPPPQKDGPPLRAAHRRQPGAVRAGAQREVHRQQHHGRDGPGSAARGRPQRDPSVAESARQVGAPCNAAGRCAEWAQAQAQAGTRLAGRAGGRGRWRGSVAPAVAAGAWSLGGRLHGA
jgi:hypothetical protein